MSLQREYDYIIVGGGTSGCVLASRLSHDPSVRVLVLEAGPLDTHKNLITPAYFSRGLSAHDWSHYATSNDDLCGRELWLPTPRALGGSSSVYPGIYLRGHKLDYDENWSKIPGCEKWTYDDVLPYFKRAENNRNGRSREHGTGGNLDICEMKAVHAASRTYVAAAVEQGLPKQYDFCVSQDGTGYFQVVTDSGARMSTASAFLRSASKRENLGLRVDSHVNKILFAEDGVTANGVSYVRNNEKFEAIARKEVILCCGAIGTAKLLMVSGIGPAEKLKDCEIKVVSDVPAVGQGLRYAVGVPIGFNCGSEATLDAEDTFMNKTKFSTIRVGPLTSPVFEAGSFFRSAKGESRPDLAIVFVPGWFVDHGRGAAPTPHGFTLMATLARPGSSGSVTVRSSDPYDKPIVDAAVLRDPADVKRLVSAVKTARHVVEGFAFSNIRGEEVVPGIDVEGEAAVTEYIRENVQTLYHGYGTCAMSSGEDGAVNPDFTVKGTKRLRVADSSVIPCAMSLLSTAPAVMIAERAADMILAGKYTLAPEPAMGIPGAPVPSTNGSNNNSSTSNNDNDNNNSGSSNSGDTINNNNNNNIDNESNDNSNADLGSQEQVEQADEPATLPSEDL